MQSLTLDPKPLERNLEHPERVRAMWFQYYWAWGQACRRRVRRPTKGMQYGIGELGGEGRPTSHQTVLRGGGEQYDS